MRHADRLTRTLLTAACAVLAAVLLWSIRNAIILSRHGDGNPNTGLTREEYEEAMNLRNDENFAAHIEALCRVFSIDPYIVRAIIGAESGWDSEAVNVQSGAAGLMQIVPGTWDFLKAMLEEEYGYINLDPLVARDNVAAGIYLLEHLTEKYKDTWRVLNCYALGVGGASELTEPCGWTRFVMKRADELRKADMNAKADAEAIKVKTTQEVIA